MTNATLARPAPPHIFGEPEPAFTSWDYSVRDSASAQGPPQLARTAGPASAAPATHLSDDLIERLLRFVAWEPGWDGESAEQIETQTAFRAMKTAKDMLPVAAEPFVAPALGGSLLLQWDFADGTSVEVYVDPDATFPESAALDRGGIVYEVPLTGHESLRCLLENRTAAPTA